MLLGYVVACNEGVLKNEDFRWSKYHNNTGLIDDAKIYVDKQKAQDDADTLNKLYDNYYYEVREVTVDCESVPVKDSDDKNQVAMPTVENGGHWYK